MSSKAAGKKPCLKRCMNWIEMREGSGKISCFLKKGFVWSLYLSRAVVFMANFCFLRSSFCSCWLQMDHIGIAYIR